MQVELTRRAALCGGCAWSLVGCGAATDPVGPGTPTPTTDRQTTDTGPGTVDGLPCDGVVVDAGGTDWFALPLGANPELADVGGWKGVTLGGRTIVVAQVAAGCWVAIDRACTHEGELVNYVASRGDFGQFVCPRHGAVYDIDGDKVSGPQPSGLASHPAGLDGDTVWVQIV